jgi:hypothetical protein
VAALSLIDLFPAPAGLAVGLALKESRYATLKIERSDSPLGILAPIQERISLLVPPRPGPHTGTSAN